MFLQGTAKIWKKLSVQNQMVNVKQDDYVLKMSKKLLHGVYSYDQMLMNVELKWFHCARIFG